jgi:hypothetical protein
VVWYTNESFFERESGKYVVARIAEDSPGYEVWDRFATLADAQAAAATANQTHGLSEADVLAVVVSSMRAGRVEEPNEYIVTFEIDEITATSHEEAARKVADMLGGDYAQRATYTVRKNGDPDFRAQHIDLSGE